MKTYKIYSIYIFILLIGILINIKFSYSQKINESINSKIGTSMIDSLMKTADKHRINKEYILSLECYFKAEKLIDKLGNYNLSAELNEALGSLFSKRDICQKAINYYKKAQTNYNRVNNINKVNEIYGIIAELFELENKPDSAIYYYSKKLDNIDNDNKIGRVNTLCDISVIHNTTKSYNNFIEINFRILKLFNLLGDKQNAIATLNNIGLIYSYRNEPDSAIKYLQRSLSLKKETGLTETDNFSTLYNIGLSLHYKNAKDYKSSTEYFFKALRVAKIKNNFSEKAKACNYIAIIYQINFLNDKALQYALRAEKMYLQHNDKHILNDTYKILLKIYQSMDNNAEVLKYFKLKSDLHDELLQTEQEHNKETVETRIQMQETEQEIKLQLSDNELRFVKYKFETAERESNQLLKLKEKELQNLLKEKKLKELLFKQKELEVAKKEIEINLLLKDKKIKELALYQKESEEKQRLKEHLRLQEEKENQIIILQKDNKIKLLTRNILFALAGIFLIMALMIYMLFKTKINKKKALLKKNKELYEAQNTLNLTALENTKLKKQKLKKELQNRLLQEEKLKSELEYNSKQLTTYTLQFIQKNKVLQDLKENISKIISKPKPDIKQDINQTLNLIEFNLNNNKEWDDFKLYFEKVNKNFFANLTRQFSNLTATDLKYSALCRMNLQMKEAAGLMAISVNSVKSARYRLRKKLNLSTEENLNEFLIKFDDNI